MVVELSNLSNLSKAFKALSNEQRLKLFLMIYKWSTGGKTKEECVGCCCEGVEKSFSRACEELNISRSTVSHHFKELISAGLITCTRNGQSYICNINEEAVEAIRQFV